MTEPPSAELAGWTIYVHNDEDWVSVRHDNVPGDTLLKMPFGWLDKKQVLNFVEALNSYQAQVTHMINCDHNHEDMWLDDDPWDYVSYEGQTWNHCRWCGLLELWAGGQFFKAVLPVLPR